MAGLSAVALTGCLQIEPLPGVRGEPADPGPELRVLRSEEPTVPDESTKVFLRDGGLTVVTFGSSSCPDIPEIGLVDAPRQVIVLNIIATMRGDELCTADLSPRTFDLDVPGDLSSYAVELAS